MGPGKGVQQGRNVVIAGTLDKLVGRLIGELESDPSILDSEYLNLFLLTYRTFTTCYELLDHIERRFFFFFFFFMIFFKITRCHEFKK